MATELLTPATYLIDLPVGQPYYSVDRLGRHNIAFPFVIPATASNDPRACYPMPMSAAAFDAYAIALTRDTGFNELWIVRNITAPPGPYGVNYPYVTTGGLMYRKSNEFYTLNAFNGTWTIARVPQRPTPFYNPRYDPYGVYDVDGSLR